MKLGILITKSGAFLFDMPSDDIIITNEYIHKHMIGWLFNAPNIYELISSLSIDKYFVSSDGNSKYGKLIEIKQEDLQQLYSPNKVSRKRIYKIIK